MSLSKTSGHLTLFLIPCLLIPGCASRPENVRRAADNPARTYYIDGAGNWGFGTHDVPEGLRRAGYNGQVINYTWSPSLNPALDQLLGRLVARLRGICLGKEITEHLRRNPDADVNIIALSAGTGVAVWACESIETPYRIRNLVMLGSSLSSDYDLREALEHISGAVYVYHSPKDAILQGPVRILGTIDARWAVEPAGIVGLHPPGEAAGRIHNIAWTPDYRPLGWRGAHTDGTTATFVQVVLSQHILSPSELVAGYRPELPQALPAAQAATTQPAAKVSLRH